jgi:hypothetical protein
MFKHTSWGSCSILPAALAAQSRTLLLLSVFKASLSAHYSKGVLLCFAQTVAATAFLNAAAATQQQRQQKFRTPRVVVL